MPSLLSQTFSFIVLLILQLLTSTTSASPHYPRSNSNSQTITEFLERRKSSTSSGDNNNDNNNDNDNHRLHLGPGPVAGIVLGIIAIVIISIFWCCPCWKFKKQAREKRARDLARMSYLDSHEQKNDDSILPVHEADSRERTLRGGGGEGFGRQELHAVDNPPRYEEVEPSHGVVAGVVADGISPDATRKGTAPTVDGYEMDGLDGRHELDGRRLRTGERGPRGLPEAHLR